MNQDVFAGQWKQMRGELKSWWGKLTDDEVDRIEGQKDRLIGLVQEKYGYTRDMAQQEVERRLTEYSATLGSPSGRGLGTTVKSTGQDLMGGAAELANAAGAKAQELGSTAASTVSTAATAVADRLGAAGSYLQERELKNMATDLAALVRRYPVPSFLLSLGLGYLLTRRSER
jgi:uncharacterized protein YjbJ (UPF0337 family)